MIRSFKAKVSPCFILMRFLSKHFIAYLTERSTIQRTDERTNEVLHFAGVGFSTSVDFAETSSTDDAMDTEVVHGQLNVQFEILPLTESRVFLRLHEFVEDSSSQEITNFFLVRLEQRRRQSVLRIVRIVFGEMFLHTFHGPFGIGLEKEIPLCRRRRTKCRYMRIGEKFFHDELIVDFFSHFPSFFVGFEFLESFDLRTKLSFSPVMHCLSFTSS